MNNIKLKNCGEPHKSIGDLAGADLHRRDSHSTLENLSNIEEREALTCDHKESLALQGWL
jgi:hypothetical protein